MSTPTNSSRLGLKIGLALLLLVVAGVVAFDALRPVAQVVLVHRGLAIDARPGSVTVQPEYAQALTSDVGGRVIKSALNEGGSVQEGDFLVQLDPADVRLQLEQLRNDREALRERIAVGSQIELQLENAKAHLANTERMFALGQVAQADLDSERNSVKEIEQQVALEKVQNRSQLATDDNDIAVKELQLKRMTITAPFNGVVTDIMAHPGAVIAPNEVIATLITNTRTVEAQISEEDFGGIATGLPASVRFQTYGDQLYGASVTQVLPKADPATQRYVVYLSVDLPAAKLTPGLAGEVSIVVGKHENALLIPRRALGFGNQIYVVSGGVVAQRRVELGFRSLTDVEVTSGVAEGEAVIAEDLENFRPGQHVRTEVLPK